MCNYCASKMGALGFSDKKLGPTCGAVYRKWKIKNHFQDSKIDQRSVNNSKKGYKRNIHITNNQHNPQNNLYWEWKKMVRIHYYEVLDKISVLNPKTVITRRLLQAYYIAVRYEKDKGFLLANRQTLLLHVAFSICGMYTKTSISGVYNLNANKPALSHYNEETINLNTGNQKSLCQE